MSEAVTDQITLWTYIFLKTVLKLVDLISVPLNAPFVPGTLLHWPFLLSAVLLTIIAYGGGRRALRFFREYFSLKVWWHPSARADYIYYLINGALFPIVFASLLATSSFVANSIAGWFSDAGMAAGEVAGTDVHWVVITAFSVAIFCAHDLGRFLGHWVQHKIQFLWEFHKIHHSAEVLTPFTSFRVHPVDLLLMSMTPGVLTGIVGGIAIVSTGGRIDVWEVLGMHAGIAAYHLVSNLRHTHVWLSYGPVLSKYLISPAQHQIHHSADEKHFHKNIGWAFAIWDRLFGTLYIPRAEEKIIFGLGDGTDSDYHGVVRMYFLPVVRAFVGLVANKN